MEDVVETLTDAQKQCLRLVSQGLTSKEIAQQTDLSHHTVDQYLHKAAIALGASNRREAARLLSRQEEGRALKDFELKPVGLVPAPDSGILTEPAQSAERQRSDRTFLSRLLSFPPLGGRENDYSSVERTEAIIKIAVVSALTMLGMALFIRAALNTFG